MHGDVDEAKRRIDDAFRNGRSSLDLSGLQLQALPPGLADLTNFTELYLGGNQLTALPHSLGNLTNLTRLYLNGNRLTAYRKTSATSPTSPGSTWAAIGSPPYPVTSAPSPGSRDSISAAIS